MTFLPPPSGSRMPFSIPYVSLFFLGRIFFHFFISSFRSTCVAAKGPYIHGSHWTRSNSSMYLGPVLTYYANFFLAVLPLRVAIVAERYSFPIPLQERTGSGGMPRREVQQAEAIRAQKPELFNQNLQRPMSKFSQAATLAAPADATSLSSFP